MVYRLGVSCAGPVASVLNEDTRGANAKISFFGITVGMAGTRSPRVRVRVRVATAAVLCRDELDDIFTAEADAMDDWEGIVCVKLDERVDGDGEPTEVGGDTGRDDELSVPV